MAKPKFPAIGKLKKMHKTHIPSYIAYKLNLKSTKTIDNWLKRNSVSAAYQNQIIALEKEL